MATSIFSQPSGKLKEKEDRIPIKLIESSPHLSELSSDRTKSSKITLDSCHPKSFNRHHHHQQQQNAAVAATTAGGAREALACIPFQRMRLPGSTLRTAVQTRLKRLKVGSCACRTVFQEGASGLRFCVVATDQETSATVTLDNPRLTKNAVATRGRGLKIGWTQIPKRSITSFVTLGSIWCVL